MNTFEEMDLIAPLQRALKDEQYKTPTPIQAKTIPVAVSGRDVLGCAQTGTGKTFTMEGDPTSNLPIDKDPNSGIIPRALGAIFDGLRTGDSGEWSVRVSFLELYNEEIFDLLSSPDDQSKLR